MTVLIDEPIWPGHGTVWAHLVSDESYGELHKFAAAAGIPERSFDHDHYDVPMRRWEELVLQGAAPVSGRELLWRLQKSGLRVKQRDKYSAATGGTAPRPRPRPSSPSAE
jgi:hypothetical protein